MKIRSLIPLKLIIAAVVLLGLSFAAGPVLSALVPDLQSSTNVLLLALPFLLVFVPIMLGFMAVIVFVSKLLHQRVPERVYKTIEYVFIAGILLGIVSMFQPWTFLLFKPGFFVLFGSLLAFMVWSHVAMKHDRR
ncbi:MAG TPA: hypothetical protein VMF68_11695 [Spirochaetia bacterium]|nr:hypothetical protein [Spirochaetia bacterium]